MGLLSPALPRLAGAASPVARALRTPLVRFAAVGAVSTLAYALLAHLAMALLGWRPGLASLAAYAACMPISYWGHRRVSFRSTRGHGEAGPRFVLASAGGYGLAYLIPWLSTERMGLPAPVATALVCVAVPAVNALVMARLVFAARLLAPAAPRLGDR
jgi:putative flippase GtrA